MIKWAEFRTSVASRLASLFPKKMADFFGHLPKCQELLLLKTKFPKLASWSGVLASGKDSRTKVVLARKLEKQGLCSTPEDKWQVSDAKQTLTFY